ncbi:M56 family metallopeptidase [Nitriliruptor alkaliphilus]|uniref:M56 family metallopeptidase n=1 Tax=Nitriliruptor alkaliphilus TaxID=427918 RepID=UPI0006967FB7|nr:M56 family metallopeptidase [Nitriliruptor alkaliphilus]
MGDSLGLLLSLPVESVAVRAILASAAGVLLVRALLRTGVRSVGARVATALAPAAALLAVLLLSSRDGLQLPTLMTPAEAVDALAVPVTDGYLHFAPVALPLLIGFWALVAGTRLTRRALAHRSARLAARSAERLEVPSALITAAARVAGRLRVPVPELVVLPTCAGGAYVVGTRRPVLVVGAALVEQLDREELEGVLAHEFAHVKRRDNLVATTLGVLRDLVFFVPGGGWAVAQLHRERERAADQVAVRATGRPGALASGLLKTLEVAPAPTPRHPCAALAPSATLVERVRELVEERPPVSRFRRGSEMAAVGSVTAVAVVLAVAVPAAVAGPDRQRDAVALVWSAPASGPGATEAAEAVPEARVFDVYRRARLDVDGGPAVGGVVRIDASTLDDRPSTWRACADPATCPETDVRGLGLVPRPVITVDAELTDRWQATPAFRTPAAGDGLSIPALYWLQRVG